MTIRTHRRVMALGMVGAAAVGFGLGRAPQPAAVAAPPPPAQTPAAPPSDYSQRVVAYIYNSIPITREDLGEYLIARHGVDQVELLVNKRIIEIACQKRGITVTNVEVEASILADCSTIGIKQAEFVDKVLKQYGKTLYEWKEDVIKPRLLLTKLVKDRIAQPTDEEIRLAFDATYGEKRECRIIIWPVGDPARDPQREWGELRESEEAFARKARTQANPALASNGGKIKPISHHAGTHPQVEDAAFKLRPGEVSELIKTDEGVVVLKLDQIIPPNAAVKFEDKRAELAKDVYDKKVNAEIPKLFAALKAEAKPVLILKKNDPMTVERESKQELEQAGMIGPAGPKP